ncbi:MAG: TetR family transcriptional regulator [Nevskia sp.]|nr:TetR family transcriptional regulator [Nevskia sp.]
MTLRKLRAARRNSAVGADDALQSAGSRDERKQRTRRALLDAALELMQGERSFSSVSLREVTRSAGVVPAAFYRHFTGMEELGLALVDDSFKTLRRSMREARAAALPATHLIRRSVETFLGYAQTHRRHFQFIAKERFGGSSVIRFAVRKEVHLFTSELSTDLARFPLAGKISTEDLQMIAGLVVQTVLMATEVFLDMPQNDPEDAAQLYQQTEKQLRLIFIGAQGWRSKGAGRG